ncbi:MAG: hypothetical protein MUE73_07465 [Planctomycetes bacterium]|nr:hypothetical protein [Planctomycetota bacterium]
MVRVLMDGGAVRNPIVLVLSSWLRPLDASSLRLVQPYLEAPDPALRTAALRCFQNVRTMPVEAESSLVRIALNGEVPENWQAAFALGEGGGSKRLQDLVIPHFLKYMGGDSTDESSRRAAAICGLYGLPTEELGAALCGYVERRGSSGEAIVALSYLTGLSARGRVPDTVVERVGAIYLSSRDARQVDGSHVAEPQGPGRGLILAAACARFLVSVGERGEEVLARAVASPSRDVRLTASMELAALDKLSDLVIRALRAGLADEDSVVREVCAQGLAGKGLISDAVSMVLATAASPCDWSHAVLERVAGLPGVRERSIAQLRHCRDSELTRQIRSGIAEAILRRDQVPDIEDAFQQLAGCSWDHIAAASEAADSLLRGTMRTKALARWAVDGRWWVRMWCALLLGTGVQLDLDAKSLLSALASDVDDCVSVTASDAIAGVFRRP